MDLFAFHDAARRVLAFAVPGTEPIPAAVDQIAATQAAPEWARRFYHLAALTVVDLAFEVTPARFWRVTFPASGQTMHLYAGVLPDGRPIGPTFRDEM